MASQPGLSREARRRLARAEANTRRHERQRLARWQQQADAGKPVIRTRRGWLVQLAAYTRSWRVLRAALRWVHVEMRIEGEDGWHELDCTLELDEQGRVRMVPRQLRGEA